MPEKIIPPHSLEFAIPSGRSGLNRVGLSEECGCYAAFTFDARDCLYVGRSKKLTTRIGAHFIDQGDGNGVRWRTAGAIEWYIKKPFAPDRAILRIWLQSDYIALEKHLIEALQPIHNRKPKYYPPTQPKTTHFGNRVRLLPEGGDWVVATVVGESRCGRAWRLNIDGHSPHTIESYAKKWCHPITQEANVR